MREIYYIPIFTHLMLSLGRKSKAASSVHRLYIRQLAQTHAQDPLIIANLPRHHYCRKMSSSAKVKWVRQQAAPLLALASILGGILLGVGIRFFSLMVC